MPDSIVYTRIDFVKQTGSNSYASMNTFNNFDNGAIFIALYERLFQRGKILIDG